MIDHRIVDQRDGIRGVSKVPLPRRRASGMDILVFVLAVVVGLWIATEVAAWAFAFKVGPGRPFGLFAHVYNPFDFVRWYLAYTNQSALARLSHAQQNAIWQVFGQSFVAGTVAVFAILALSRPLLRRSVPGILGDDSFATDADLRKWGYVGKPKGIILGTRMMRDRGVPKRELVRDPSEGHTLFAMGTGQGKNAAVLTPTLLDDGLAHATVIVDDPPGEVWKQCAGANRAELGKYCFRLAWGLDPERHPDVAPWNPYLEVPRGSKRDIMVVRVLGQKHIDRDGGGAKGKNSYFYLAAMMIHDLNALMHIYGESEGLAPTGEAQVDTMARQAETFSQFLDFAKNMDYSCHGKFSWTDPMTGKQTNKHPVALRLAGLAGQIRDEELGSVLQTYNNGMSMYANPIIAANTRTSAFQVSRLMDYDRPVFAIMEADVADEETLLPLRNSFKELFLALNQSSEFLATDERGGTTCTHRYEAYFFLNEAYSGGKITAVERGATTARKFGIHIVPMFQTISQIEQLYGKNNSLEEMMTTKIFSATGSPEAAEKISGYSGTQTIAYDTDSIQAGGGLSFTGHVNSAPVLAKRHALKIPYEQLFVAPVPTKRVPASKSFVLDKFEYFGDQLPKLNALLKRRAMMSAPSFSDMLPMQFDEPTAEAAQERGLADLQSALAADVPALTGAEA